MKTLHTSVRGLLYQLDIYHWKAIWRHQVVVHLPSRFGPSTSAHLFTSHLQLSICQIHPTVFTLCLWLAQLSISNAVEPFSHMTFVNIVSLVWDGSTPPLFFFFHHSWGSRGGLWVTRSNSIRMTDARSPGSTAPALLHSFIPLWEKRSSLTWRWGFRKGHNIASCILL